MRVGLLGAGFIAPFHARAVQASGGTVAAVAGGGGPTAAALAERLAIPRVHASWQELAGDAELDAVVVATPNALHAPQAIACLEAGKHVLVEKPMARTVAEADAMLAAASRAGRTLMVAHCWRFHPDVRALRARIAAGELGRVVRTHGYGAHAGWGPSGWFCDRELAGGGALLDMGVHAIDTARFLLGEPKPLRVSAVVGTHHGAYAVDDDALLLIAWDDGSASVVESGWWQPRVGGPEADTEIYGTQGYARVWPETPAEGEHLSQAMFDAQMAEFLAAARAGRAAEAADGRLVMAIVEEAYRSARELGAPGPAGIL